MQHPILRYIEQRRSGGEEFRQVDFARLVGLSPTFVNDLVRGRTPCGRRSALKIVRGTGGRIRLEELLTWEPPEKASAA